MEDKSTIKYTPFIISISIFMLLVFSAGYSYFIANITSSNITNINAVLPGVTSLTTTSNNCSLNFSHQLMNPENVSHSVNSSCFLNVTINGSKSAFCTYDVMVEEIGANTYTPSNGIGVAPNLYEFTGSITGAATVPETQMNTLKGTKVVQNKLITVATNNVAVTQTYNMVEKWYNVNVSQDTHSNKSYVFRFYVTNVTC